MNTTVFHTGPVTALCCHDNTVLAGVGSCLYVYSVPDGSNKFSVEVLHGRNVHGIRPESCSGETQMCIFGQKCIRLVNYDPKSFQVRLLTTQVEFPDWIWDIKWLKDVSALSLAFGHNVVVIYDFQKQQVVESAHCQEKCIIYCANFITDKREDLVLAAGTVFNQVVVWSPVGKPNSEGRRDVIHRLTGHQGVIFSIDYDPESQRICSASDDRSIILYQVKFPRPMTSPSLDDWENMDSSPLHMLYGHSARVWDVWLLRSVFVTVGEDSTCCVWSYEGHVIQKFKGHKGKSIWSMAVDRGENYVVTGGGDHSIRLWNLQPQGAGPGSKEISAVVPLQAPDEDFPRNTLLLGLNRVLVLTNMGNLLLFNHGTQKTTSLMSDVMFSSYSVIAVSQQGTLIAVGNIHGTLRVYSCTDALWEDISQVSSRDVGLYKGRLFSIHWLDETTLLVTGPDGVLSLCQVEVDHRNNSITCDVTCNLELPASKHRWVSAVAYSPDCSYIVCGDRVGSIYLYCITGEKQCQKPVQTFPKIHGKAGLTSVCCHGNHVYTTGRDGLYRVFAWTEEQHLQLQNSNRVYKGFEWLEKLIIEEEEVKIQGFHSNMFVVWSVQSNQKLLEVECGGGHRAWGFCCRGNKAQFVFVKSREVIIKTIDVQQSQTILKGSLHGRELCDAKYLCTRPVHEGGFDVLVTCSEDTSICISALHYNAGIPALRVLHTLSGHISSVRCLSVCPSSLSSKNSRIQKKLIFSGGGRAQMRVSRVSVHFQTTDRDILVETDKERFNICSEIDSARIVSEKGKVDTSETDAKDNSEIDQLDQTETDSLGKSEMGPLDEMEGQSGKLLDICLSSDKDASLKCNATLDASRLASRGFDQNTNDCSSDRSVGNMVKCNIENLAVIQLGQSGRRQRKPWRHLEEYSDPETRILDISVVTGEELGHSVPAWLYFLSVACSDGLVRFFAFDERTREINQLSSSSYHDHCVLKTCHVILRKDTASNVCGHMTNVCGHVTNQGDHAESEDNCGTRECNISTDGLDLKATSDHVIHSDYHVTTHSDDKYDHVIHSDSHVTANSDDVTTRCDHVIVLTAATDGVVAFWDVTELCESFVCDSLHSDSSDNGIRQGQTNRVPYAATNEKEASQMSPFFTLCLHQSGINSIHISKQSDIRYMLLTGGDDNAVKVNMITMDTKKGDVEVKVLCQGSNEHAHSAQITGVFALSPTTILTASIDQRVCIWAITEEEKDIKLTLLDCRFVDVMDIANIDVRTFGTKHRVMLSGEGLQIVEVDTGDRDRPAVQPVQTTTLAQ